MINRYLSFAALYLASAVVVAAPSVTGNTISWPDNGWYQVQRSDDYTTVCNGGSSCVVPTGSYKVINHTTGEKFRDIVVSASVPDDSPISVVGNVISWPDDGWYQVQRSSDYTTICNGGTSCVVEAGTYKVINHTTGEKFRGIEVPGGTVDHVQASLELVADKTFRIRWQPFDGAEFYRVFENQDGVSGFSQISDDLEPSTHIFDHRVPLYSRVNARFLVQACNNSGCVDSLVQNVVGTLDGAIGYLKASNTDKKDFFGGSVSLSADGNTLAVGAEREDSAATGINGNQTDNSTDASGAVYVFARINGNWQQQAYLKASNTDSEDGFGWSLSLSADGNTLAVGAVGEDSAATGINGDQNNESEYEYDSGAVYVFVRSKGSWLQEAYLKASNPDFGNFFGESISLSADGNTLAVGARGEDSAATGINGDQNDSSALYSGAAYVFARINGIWQQQTYVKASNTDSTNRDFFGWSISLSANGNTLAVGAPREESAATGINGDQYDNSASNSGAVYVFARINGDWQQQAYLKASNTDSEDEFGRSVSLSADGNALAVGAWYEDSAATGINGNQDDNSADTSGAVYVFVRNDGSWLQQAYLKASNVEGGPEGYTPLGDNFGAAISLSADGNILAVGARYEDSAATGLNGNENDNSAYRSGAVYVFARSSGVWQQQAYLKASNTGTPDRFGSSISLSADGNTLAVGALHEHSAATGINGEQNDNSFLYSGAVYLY